MAWFSRQVSLLLNSKKWLVRQKGKMKLDKQVKLVKQDSHPHPHCWYRRKRLWPEPFHDSRRWCGQTMQPSKGCSRLSSPFRVWYKERRPPGRSVPNRWEGEDEKVLWNEKTGGGSSQELSFCSSTNASGLVNHQPKRLTPDARRAKGRLRKPFPRQVDIQTSRAAAHGSSTGQWPCGAPRPRKEPLKTQTWRLVKGEQTTRKDSFSWFYKLTIFWGLMCWIRTS